ncbi:MAG: threonine/serine exporter family protein [Phascolarctobacterium faecium]
MCNAQWKNHSGAYAFVPGVAFTNGLRDYMAGDLLSGNARIAEALLLLHLLLLVSALRCVPGYCGWDLWK